MALALCLAFSFITLSSNAQVDPTTGNLINSGTSPTYTTSTWNNGVYVNSLTCWAPGGPGNCGPNPSVLPSGQVHFSYGQVDLNQIVNINRALAAGGTGVQLSGFNFSFTAKNGNGWDDGRQDYLAAYVKLYNAGGGLAANYDYSAQTNRKYNWTNFSFNETFASPLAASQYSNAQVGFVGRDNNFWAGNYGPEIFNVSFNLKYRVDPCATNPAYSSTCTGFNAITTGSNVFNSSVWSNSINQSVAINTALRNGGIGATVHGINYGFDYTIGQSWSGCTATNQDGSCSWYMNIPAQASATAQLTNSNNQSLFSKNHTLTGDGTSGSVAGQYLLPSSLNQTSLGNVRLYGSTSGAGSSIGNFSASLIYTADPCVNNPLYNASCNGYAVAFAKNMLLGSTVAGASGAITSPVGPMSGTIGPMEAPGNPQLEQTQQSPQQTQQQAQQPQQQSGPGPAQDAGQNPSVAQDNPAQPSPQQAGPASTTPQPAGGPPQTATASASSSSGPSGGGSAGPSKLAMSVVKTAQANDKATQNAAVQNASKTLENAVQSSQASSSAAITMNQDKSANSATTAAAFASQSTQTSMQASVQTNQLQQSVQSTSQTQQASRMVQQVQQVQQDMQQQQSQTTTSIVTLQSPKQDLQQQSQTITGTTQNQPTMYVPPAQSQQDTQSTQIIALKPPTPPVTEIQQNSSGTGLTIGRNLFAYNPFSINSSNSIQSQVQTASVYQPRIQERSIESETPQVPVTSFIGGRAGNPLSEILMQQRFEMMQNNTSLSASSVNKNVQSNELAGGIDLTAMATVPQGFNTYSLVLKDATFYEPKEVYKNQRTVDNERVLRGLTRGSDSLHQQMVDQQYKVN